MNYIQPSKGRVYRFIASLPSVYRYALLMLVCAITMYAWFYLMYRPLSAMMQRYQVMVQELQSKQTLYEKTHAQTTQMSDTVHTMQRALMAHTSSAQTPSITNMTSLVEIATASGLIFVSCACNGEQDQPWASSERIQLVVRGSIDQMNTFFQALTTTRGLCKVHTMDITHLQETLFSLSCCIELYTLKRSCFC